MVTNLTLAIDEHVLKRARIRALEQGTTVNALVREYLESFARDERKAAIAHFLELARASTSGSGPQGRTWTREDLYDR